MNKNLSPGPAALAVCGLVIGLILSISFGAVMIVGAVVWHFAEQGKPEAQA